jgi:CBS domain containing-hemolysin-like protein
MAEKLGRIPEEGDCISAEGYNFSVLKMDDKRVAKIRLTKKTEAEE